MSFSADDAYKDSLAQVTDVYEVFSVLSLYYDGMVDELGNPTEAYIYSGVVTPDEYDDEAIAYKDIMIEAGAVVKAGQVVKAVQMPFEYEGAPTHDAGYFSFKIKIANINRVIAKYSRAAMEAGQEVYAHFRVYKSDDPLGSLVERPVSLALKFVSLANGVATAEVTMKAANLANTKWPMREFDMQNFGALYSRNGS
ncbi:MAG: DUF1833 family protein [Rhizobiales bacterium]|nr:DUF1833 domain-containing protein [Hyphomicrobiales bacterium]NRB15047.1 DUF1833 family protein [Hyphomicrobiales bacterium]